MSDIDDALKALGRLARNDYPVDISDLRRLNLKFNDIDAIRRALEVLPVPEGYFVRIQHDPLDQQHRRWYVALFPADQDQRFGLSSTALISNASGATQHEAMTKALAAAPTPEDSDQ